MQLIFDMSPQRRSAKMARLQVATSTPCQIKPYNQMVNLLAHDLVIVSCEGTRFKAHKNILCYTSRYFMYLFMNSTNKEENNVYELKWLYPAQVVQQALLFIYEGNCEIQHKELMTMFRLADKYNIVALIRLCEDHLWTRLRSANCAQHYLVAHMYCLQNKKAVREYVCCTMKLNKKVSENDLLDLCKRVAK